MSSIAEPLPNSAPAEQDYTVQLHAGFASLRFMPGLESQFRAFYRRFCLTHVRFGLVIGALLLPVSAALNRAVFELPAGLMGRFDLLVLGLAWLPMLGLLAYFSRNRDGRRLPELMAGYLLAAAAYTLLLRCFYARHGLDYPYTTESYAALFTCLLAGLRLRPALLVIGVWLLEMLVFQQLYPQPGAAFAERLYNWAGIAFLAMGAGYAQEYLARANFLLREISRYRSEHDPLTGLLNRRGFEERCSKVFAQSRREGKPFGLLLVDVDNFKKYNDFYGHPQGDLALSAVAEVLRQSARRGFDFAGRLGGEEFALVWYDAPPSAAANLAEAVRRSVEELGFKHRASATGNLTISGGALSVVATPGLQLTTVLKAADTSLYSAKEAGRNLMHFSAWTGAEGSA